MNWFKRTKETKFKEVDIAKEMFLTGKSDNESINRQKVSEIPSVSAGAELIAETFAGLEFKLYKDLGEKVEEVKGDIRTYLLNDYTNDILTGYDMKKAVALDYLYDGNGYIYIKKDRNSVTSLHYVESNEVSINESNDPIVKDNIFNIRGEEYKHFDFISIARKTKNGSEGKGIISEHNLILSTMYNALDFENSQMKTGGIKKGVVKSVKRLSEDALDKLKTAWKKLYGKDSKETCVILNDGLDYKELQQTSVEMQLLENKKQNADEGLKLLKIPIDIFHKPTLETKSQFVAGAINPLIDVFEAALNKSLLLEKEKGKLFFAADKKDLNKGDIEKRYKAYEIGLKNGFILTNEVRYLEDLPKIEDFNYLRMSLGEVLYNIDDKTIFTPNTGQTQDSKKIDLKGGDNHENRDKE